MSVCISDKGNKEHTEKNAAGSGGKLKGVWCRFSLDFPPFPEGHFTFLKSIQIEQGGPFGRSLRPGVPIRPPKRTHCAFQRPISLLYVDVKDNV